MSLEGEYDYENIFVKILQGDIPCAKVYEDEHVLSFMDAFPQSEGHVLVIPKAPSRNLLDASPKTLGRMIGRTQKIARSVKAALAPDGIRIMQFNGAPAGQTVFHLHFHIIPVYKNSKTSAHASGDMADMAQLELIAAKIREDLEKDPENE